MFKILLSCILLTAVSATNCTFPEHTATQLYVSDCSDESAMLKTTTGAAYKQGTTINEYPIDAIGIVDVVTNVINMGLPLPTFYRDMTVFIWEKDLFDQACKWHSLPTLNMSGCSDVSCPLKTSENTLRHTFNFTEFHFLKPLFQTQYAYKMRIQDKASSNGSYIGCVDIEARIVAK